MMLKHGWSYDSCDSGLAAQQQSYRAVDANPVPQATSINVWQLSSMQHEMHHS
jgi:hypothetical protein